MTERYIEVAELLTLMAFGDSSIRSYKERYDGVRFRHTTDVDGVNVTVDVPWKQMRYTTTIEVEYKKGTSVRDFIKKNVKIK